ncbi:DUF1772 domain-containing protein [Streptomyces sp. NPDC093109]|uniref:DUF1772 domain-containing protein n=1 Tax=Streptomyces sp. NPDC093109 TaxID=3154977 RepID=UPI0034505E5E
MGTLSQVLAVVAILANSVVYGTDTFCALVQRPALAQVDDAALTSVMGQVHRYGDRRMPVPGAVGLIAAVLASVLAAVDGRSTEAVACAVASVALIGWLVVYARISAPVNKRLTAAALAGTTPDDARSLQRTWDGVINLRVALQSLALIALCVAVATH